MIKSQLQTRGATTIRGISRVFRQMDSFDGNKKVDFEEFITGLRDIGVKATNAEFEALHSVLDTDGDGRVDFTEFLVAIRVLKWV